MIVIVCVCVLSEENWDCGSSGKKTKEDEAVTCYHGYREVTEILKSKGIASRKKSFETL